MSDPNEVITDPRLGKRSRRRFSVAEKKRFPATASTARLAPARANVEDITEELHIIGNQGLDTEQLTAYLRQAHGVLLELLLVRKITEQPKTPCIFNP